MKVKFYYGYFLQIIGTIVLVASVSDMVNSIFGIGVGLVLMAVMPAFSNAYFEKPKEVEMR